MKWSRWMEQPRWLALLTLAFALAPVGLAVVTYRDARQKDERLFETSAQVLTEQLKRSLERYDYFIRTMRSQTVKLDLAALSQGRMAPAGYEWKKSLPHMVAFGFAEQSGGRVVLRWKSEEQAPVTNIGEELTSDPRVAAMMKPAGNAALASTPECLLDQQRLFSMVSVLGNGPSPGPRGYLVAWINLESLCRDADVPLIGDRVLSAIPLSGDAPTPAGAKRMNLRGDSPSWAVAIARGDRFIEQYGPPTPWPAFIAIALSAVPLLVIVTLAGRAVKLRSALAAEREVVRQQRFFTQSVSHEFRTPLTVILSGTELLESYAERLAPGRRAEVLAEIKDSTRHMSEMIERVLLLGRIDSDRLSCQPKPVNLSKLCHDLARKVTTATHSRTTITVTAPDRDALLDASLVGSVLENLLSNAVKYSAPGRPVTLDVTARHDQLIFTVRDEGVGIPAGDVPRVCDPFHRGENVGAVPGTGLGLAIAQRCATLHGGTLKIESEEGRGTIATVTLPLVTPA